MAITEDREVETEVEDPEVAAPRRSFRRTTAIATAGMFSVLAVAPVVTTIVSPESAPQAAAAPGGKHCYKNIAFRGPIEVPCVAKPLTQAQRECLIGLGVAVMIDVGTGGVIGGPAVVAAAISCGVKFLSTPV